MYWDKFYLKKRGFVASSKERNWLCREFKEIVYDQRDDIDALEIGCGLGNTIVPLCRVNPSLHFLACDISEKVVAQGRPRRLTRSQREPPAAARRPGVCPRHHAALSAGRDRPGLDGLRPADLCPLDGQPVDV